MKLLKGYYYVFRNDESMYHLFRGQKILILNIEGDWCNYRIVTGELTGRVHRRKIEDVERELSKPYIKNKGRWIF